MKILLWYAHGSYVNALVRGEHEYLVPDVDPSGAGAPNPTMAWPAGVRIVGAEELAADPPDLVVCQRLEEIDACARLTGRTPGQDLPAVLGGHGVDNFGIDGDRLPAELPGTDVVFGGNFGPEELHAEIAHLGLYLHLNRWTSLGLSLLEAMHLGMPVVVLQTTEAVSLPPEIGAVSLDLDALRRRTHALLTDPDDAARCGAVAREVVLQRYSLAAFLARWDDAFTQTSALPVAVA